MIISAVEKKILLKGGGHKMAGGFSIEMDKIDLFKEFIFKKFNSVNIDLNTYQDYYFD